MGVSITVPRKRTINQYSVPLSEKPSDHYTLIWKACLNNVIADMKLRFGNDKEHLIDLST